MPRDAGGWSEADLEQLRERGVPPEEAARQLAHLRGPRRYVRLVRPCTVGDGIRRIGEDEVEPLLGSQAEAASAGRFTRFVPASGAATRMFRDLLRFQRGPDRGVPWPVVLERANEGDAAARNLVRFFDGLRRFAFWGELARRLGAGETLAPDADLTASYGRVLDVVLGADAMGYAELPKGLLKFHAYADEVRTPFEEHLVEAADCDRDATGSCRLHFTVAEEHREAFEGLLAATRDRYETRLRARFEVAFSTQDPSTDTLAVDLAHRPFRDAEGRLVFRPGGHGALIENLAATGADLVYLKNIDNVTADEHKSLVGRWDRLLGGYLVELQRRSRDIVRTLREKSLRSDSLEQALRFAGTRLQIQLNGRFDARSPEARRAWLLDRLSRPIRVCGVVTNAGEPGGGPFWVRDGESVLSLQIVEGAQVDPENTEQGQIFRGSTHFNPVNLVCGLRDVDGRPFDLNRFVDPGTAIVTRKSFQGRELLALERPGLWNGAMAGWNTIFVEVPLETFAPVKTVLDLLRPEHQPRATSG